MLSPLNKKILLICSYHLCFNAFLINLTTVSLLFFSSLSIPNFNTSFQVSSSISSNKKIRKIKIQFHLNQVLTILPALFPDFQFH